MKLTLKEVSELIKGELIGDPSIVITGISGIKEAKKGDITFLANSKYAALMEETHASAIITGRDVSSSSKPLLRTDDPSLAFTKIVSLALPDTTKHPKGIHPSACISTKAKIGARVSVGPFAIIEDDACIGDDTIIYGGCYIGYETTIGAHCLLYPQVSIRERNVIGNKVIIHSGAVIGSDGFGFIKVNGVQMKIPQIGTVVVEDEVEIGANVAIDRARFNKTIIGRGTKIDNLVQIAHNVILGQNCTIVSQAGISGSTIVGNNAILAGQAGIVGHISIGESAIVAAQAGVTKSVPAGIMVSGYPAKPHTHAKKVNACVQNLPKLHEKIKVLEAKIEALEKRLKGKND